MSPLSLSRLIAIFLASTAALFADGPPAASATRVNWAKFQAAWSDSAASDAQFATDGIVNAANAWRSNTGAGGHWVGVTLPAARLIGSVQVFLGNDDTGAIANFSLNYDDGSGMQPLPGGNFTGNTATVLNVVLASPVTVRSFMLYTTDNAATVREISLLPPNAGGWPIGADVTLNLARQREATTNSMQGTNFPRGAVDGYSGPNTGRWRSASANGPHSLTVELGATQRIGSAHLFSGSASAAAIANFRLQYWTGTTWFDVPGGVISGNTQKERVVNFTTPVSTSRVLLLMTDNGAQTVRELVIFPASTGVTSFPIGTSVTLAEPPTAKAEDLGDSWWKLQNRHSGGVLTAGNAGASEARAFTPENAGHFQVLYNLGSDTYRLRHRATGQCLEAQNAGSSQGTAAVLADYAGQPHQLWRIVDKGDGYGQYVNAWSGLALETDAASPATVTLAPPSTDWRQQWQLGFQSASAKKGLADYGWDWAKARVEWNYNWSHDPFAPLPIGVAHSPMQWGAGGIGTLAARHGPWQADGKPFALLGFNEPDFADGGGSNVSVADALTLWPQLEAANLPLVSPAPAIMYGSWFNDFIGQANARGYRMDYVGVHWYGPPDAAGLVAHLQGIHTTYGRPIWLTEFATTDWSGTATWSEEDNYRFLTEFLWMAEDHAWLKRYAAFPGYQNPPAAPWTRTAPHCHVFDAARNLTAVGDVYAGWDGDRTVRADTPYILHGKGAALHLGNDGAIRLGTIRENGMDMQWALVPTTWSQSVVQLVSLSDGRKFASDGTGLYLAAPSATGGAVEWTYTHSANGYFALNHGQSGKRLRINRTNDGNGAPTGAWLSMDSGSASDDFVQLRFIKPASAADAANLPAGWSAQDIGEPAQRGAAFYDSGNATWSITGGGSDIFSTSDQFQFVSRSASGDTTLIARVASVQNSSDYAKAGVMFRAGSAADAAFAHLFVGPSTVGFEYRAASGTSAQASAYLGASAPRWLKLVRTGNTFRAFQSSNGTTWTQLGTAQTIPMPTSTVAGLAITSHDNATLNTSTFTNVALTMLSSFESWQYQYFTAAQLADANISLSSADANSDGELNLMKFATAQSPLAPTRSTPALVKNGATLEFTYTRSLAAMADGVTFTVEWRDSLTTGSWSSAGVSEQILTNNGAVQTIRANVPAGTGSRFARLRVVK